MPRRREIVAHATSAAPPERVFALLADGATYPAWSPIDGFRLEREGEPPPEGPGAIRCFTRGRTPGRDEVVALESPRRLAYRSLSGLPVRGYEAEVVLASDGSGTAITWRATFAPAVPGTGALLAVGLRRFLRQMATGLAAGAAR